MTWLQPRQEELKRDEVGRTMWKQAVQADAAAGSAKVALDPGLPASWISEGW